jgi:uncharacterized protein (DUF849 family)
MAKSGKVIITCAITGSLHVPSMSPHLPITPDEIVNEAVAAAEAGAAIIHLHARDPATGRPSSDPSLFRDFMARIASRTDAVLNMTTGGAPGMTLDERLQGPLSLKPEMTSLNMGSINNGLFASVRSIGEFKFDWERPYMESTKATVFQNTFADIEGILARLGREHRTRFEFECYDVGHLYNLAYLMDRKLYEPPIFLQFILGVLGGIGASIDNLAHMKRTADSLFGASAYEFSVLGVGRHQMGLCAVNALLGGNVRVGLEDSLYIGRGELARSNAQQVARVRRVLEELSFEIATPAEARARLGLKGADAVGF